jgi:hypothetical protein
MAADGSGKRPRTRQLTVRLPAEAVHILERKARADNMTTTSYVEARLGELVGFLRARPRRPSADRRSGPPAGYL